MNSQKSHTERTAGQTRQSSLHAVKLASIHRVNARTRLLTLALPYTIHFLPGQWLDVHIPTLSRAGGFTITSSPFAAIASQGSASIADNRSSRSRVWERSKTLPDPLSNPIFELAVQESPSNPPAAWLWRPEDEILGSSLLVRVGGNFVWPPPGRSLLDGRSVIRGGAAKRLVFVAGGVGINPLMSILAYLSENEDEMPPKVFFAYGTKVDGSSSLSEILFLPRLLKLFCEKPNEGRELELYATGTTLTGTLLDGLGGKAGIKLHRRRMNPWDLLVALGPLEERHSTFIYVCGPQTMTDEIVGALKKFDGIDAEKVLCEKWW